MATEGSTSASYAFTASIEYPKDDGVYPLFANNVVVQIGSDGYVLGFYSVFPPIVIGSEAEINASLSAMKVVNAKCVSKILLSPEEAKRLATVLTDAIAKHGVLTKVADGK